MYNTIANKLANILISFAGDSIDGKCKNIEVITYGIELLISSIVNLIFVMIMGDIFLAHLQLLFLFFSFVQLGNFQVDFTQNPI